MLSRTQNPKFYRKPLRSNSKRSIAPSYDTEISLKQEQENTPVGKSRPTLTLCSNMLNIAVELGLKDKSNCVVTTQQQVIDHGINLKEDVTKMGEQQFLDHSISMVLSRDQTDHKTSNQQKSPDLRSTRKDLFLLLELSDYFGQASNHNHNEPEEEDYMLLDGYDHLIKHKELSTRRNSEEKSISVFQLEPETSIDHSLVEISISRLYNDAPLADVLPKSASNIKLSLCHGEITILRIFAAPNLDHSLRICPLVARMRKRFKEDISLLAEFYRQCKGELSLVNIRGYLLNNEIRYTSKELAELSTQLLLNSETDAARLMEIAFFVNNDQICRDIVCTSDAVRQVRDTNQFFWDLFVILMDSQQCQKAFEAQFVDFVCLLI